MRTRPGQVAAGNRLFRSGIAGKPGGRRPRGAGGLRGSSRGRAAGRRNLGLGGRRRSGARISMATARSSGSFWAVQPPRPIGRAWRGIRELPAAPRVQVMGTGHWREPGCGDSQGCGQGQAGACEGDAASNPRTPDGPGAIIRPQFLQAGIGWVGEWAPQSNGPSQTLRPRTFSPLQLLD